MMRSFDADLLGAKPQPPLKSSLPSHLPSQMGKEQSHQQLHGQSNGRSNGQSSEPPCESSQEPQHGNDSSIATQSLTADPLTSDSTCRMDVNGSTHSTATTPSSLPDLEAEGTDLATANGVATEAANAATEATPDPAIETAIEPTAESTAESTTAPAAENNIDIPDSANPIDITGITDITSITSSAIAPPDTNHDIPPSGCDEEPEEGLLPVLKNSNFLILWSGQVFSQLADKVYLVLMIALIASRFQEANQTISGWVSSLMIAFTIPAILFGSIAGVYVDHWRKRAVLVSTNLLRGGLVLGLPLLLWFTHDWGAVGNTPVGFMVVLGVTFLVSTLTQFFAPAEQAAIPLIVEKKHLLSANSLYTMTMMASVIVGFALGEPVLALADYIFAPLTTWFNLGTDVGKELLVGGSYAIAGLLLMLINTHEKQVHSDESLPDVWANIRDGLRYLKHQGKVRAALIHLVTLFSVFAALAVLVIRLAEVMPEIKSSQFGFLLSAGGVGMAIGAVLVGQFGQRFSRAQLSLYGSLGMGGCLTAISFTTHQLIPTLPLFIILGSCAAFAGIPMQTAIQEETPPEMRGKVFGLQNNAINIALSLPLALAGLAESWLGLRVVFLALAVMAIAGGLLSWSISRSHAIKD